MGSILDITRTPHLCYATFAATVRKKQKPCRGRHFQPAARSRQDQRAGGSPAIVGNTGFINDYADASGRRTAAKNWEPAVPNGSPLRFLKPSPRIGRPLFGQLVVLEPLEPPNYAKQIPPEELMQLHGARAEESRQSL
jgi:hypothetical protein